MIRIIISILLIIFIGWLISDFAPWYAVVFAGFLGALPLRRNVGLAFIIGFVGGFALWFLSYQSMGGSNHELTARMAALMGLNNALLLTFLGSAIGGLLAAMGAASCNVLKKYYPNRGRSFDR